MSSESWSAFTKQACQIITIYTFMFILMTTTITSLAVWNWWVKERRHIITYPNSTYDFIIVGGGTAGCVLAARLSEDQSYSVLLIEAGEHFSWLSSVPLAVPLLQGSSRDWAYRTVPQVNSSWGLRNNSSAWPRGKGLGGSGQINYLLHFSGSPEDFTRWESLGASGWSYPNLKMHMDKILGVSSHEDTLHCTSDYYSLLTDLKTKNEVQCSALNGKNRKPNLHISKTDTKYSVLLKAFESSGEEHGLNVKPAESTVLEGERWSSLHGFLKPAFERPNLHVILSSRVLKILHTKQKNTNSTHIVGVTFQNSNNETWNVYCKNGVILSAGAIETPKLLILSGVGPSEMLTKLNINIVKDLPVGQNLHDHMNLPLYVSLQAPVSITLDKLLSVSQIWKYLRHGKGYYATSGIIGVGSTVDNQLGLVLFGLGTADEQLLCGIANYKPQTFRSLFPFSRNSSQEGFVFLITCLQPKSRGQISLTSNSPYDHPSIDPNYLYEADDLNCMSKGVKLANKLVNSKQFKQLGARLHLPVLPQCQQYNVNINNEEYIHCIIRTAAITGHHPGGTCKIGKQSDKTSVVDHNLRVHGTENLYVVDASVLPTPVSGHPNSVIIAMADRAANLIARDRYTKKAKST